jgi:hypothetical protein
MSLDKLKKAESLAAKLDKLNSQFEIAESTVYELAEYIDNDIEINEEVDDADILSMKMLKEDFKMIRNTLLDTIDNGKKVISNLTQEILTLEGNSGSAISAYAELIMTVNSSMKLLTETYQNIIKLQKEMSKPEQQSDGSPQLGANISEIIRKIKHENLIEAEIVKND